MPKLSQVTPEEDQRAFRCFLTFENVEVTTFSTISAESGVILRFAVPRLSWKQLEMNGGPHTVPICELRQNCKSSIHVILLCPVEKLSWWLSKECTRFIQAFHKEPPLLAVALQYVEVLETCTWQPLSAMLARCDDVPCRAWRVVNFKAFMLMSRDN